MVENPLVSVVIPTYNRADMVVEAVDSVLKQTYSNVEVVVVDDGSTDNTRELVEAIPDERVLYLYKENNGASSARNLGILEAQGEYIAFLDSDDLFFPQKLEIQIRYLQERPYLGMLYCGFILTGRQENVTTTHPATLSGQPIVQMMTRTEIGTLTVVIPRRVFANVGLFNTDLRSIEDMEFWVRITRHYEIDSIPEPLAEVRVNSFNPYRAERIKLEDTLAAWDTIFMATPDISWLDRRRLYGLPYFIALNNIYQMFPEYPKDISYRFIFSCIAHILYYYPFSVEYQKIIFKTLLSTLLPKKLYMRLHPLLKRIFTG